MKVGLRTWKTVLSVFICFMLDELRNNGIPFYSVIASILCIQKNTKDSFKEGKKREITTIIGAIAGVIYLYIERLLPSIQFDFIRYILLSLLLIPIIQVSRLLKQEGGTFLMCVVFLSVTVNHNLDISPLTFAINRVIDTSIGILVGISINSIPFHKIKEISLKHPSI